MIGFQLQEAVDVEFRIELAGLVLDPLAELEDGDALFLETQRSPAGVELHAFGDRELDLVGAGRHVAALLERGQVHVPRALPQGRQGDVDRDVSAADDDDPRPDAHRLSAARGAQEVDAAEDERKMGALDGQEASLLRAEPEEDGVVLLAELLDARNRRAGEDPDTQGPDLVDLLLEQVGRVPVGGDAVAQHSAGVLLRLVDLDVVSEGAQEVGRREAGRAGADETDPLARLGRKLGLRVAAVGEAVLGRLGLHRPDEDGAVVAAADAGGFARGRADEAAGQRQRVVAPDDLDGGAIVPVAEVGHEARDVDVRRAGAVAGRGPRAKGRAPPGRTPAGRGAPTARGSGAASCRAATRPPAPAWRTPSPSRRARRDARPRRGRA